MARYFLGVDTGGTKSHALVADETGQALGFGVGGSGNHEIVGWDGLAAVLREIVGEALAQAGIAANQIAGAGFGLAGYDWPSERPGHLRAVEPLGLSAPFDIVVDPVVGLLAGSTQGWGVALVSGTGNNCWGRDRAHRIGRITGHGIAFGEGGGASDLVILAIHAVVAEWGRRGPATCVTPAFVHLAGATDVDDLVEGLTQGRYMLDAGAAPEVFRCAERGDAVAIELIARTGRDLGSLAVGVIHQLELEELEFEVVLVGSMFDGGPLLVEPMRETILAVAPGACFVRLTTAPVVGGVVLGMEQAGLDAAPCRQRLIETTNALIRGR